METSLIAAIVAGLGLGSVLAVAAVWSRTVSDRRLPHLGVGALVGVAVLSGGRLTALPAPLMLIGVAAFGGGVALAAHHLDRGVRRSRHPQPWLPDVAVLAALLALAALIQLPTALPLPFGPLGGRAGYAGSFAALAIGGIAVLFLASRTGRALLPRLRWMAAGAALSVTAVLAAGVLEGGLLPGTGLTALPDTAGLAVRATTAALLGRRGSYGAAAAGLVLGVAESVLTTMDPLGGLGMLPALIAGAVGLTWWWTTHEAVPAEAT